MNQRILGGLILSVLALTGLTSCNLYGGLDSPSGDYQLLSAARACLDQADFTCAKNYYNQLSQNDNDIKLSELAFADLEQIGVGMQAFAAAFGNGKNINIGTAMTSLANVMIPLGPGPALRTRIYQDFSNELNISDSNLKGLVKFLAATTFAAEILAEIASTENSSQLLQTNIADNPAGCTVLSCTKASATVKATATVNKIGGTGNTSLDLENGSTTNINVPASATTLNLFVVSLTDINDGMSRLGKAGSFASNFTTFINQFGSLADDNAVRYAILQNNIGY